MKTAKRILTVALALMLIFALAAPSFALHTTGSVPTYGGVPYYIQGSDSLYEMDGTFTVYLSIYSGIYGNNGAIERTIPVTMGSTGATDELYTVYDVYIAAASQYSYLFFDTTTPNVYHQSWLQGVKDTTVNSNTWFTAQPLKYDDTTYYCGWMFRINGMIPYFTHLKNGNTVTEGCLITDAYVTAGDTVDLYFSNVYTQDLSTKVIWIDYKGTTNGVSTFQVLTSDCFVPTGQTNWTLTTWAKIVDSTLNIIIDGSIESIDVDANGEFTLTGLSSGNHSFQFETMIISYEFIENNVTYDYWVPYYAGMYSVYSI